MSLNSNYKVRNFGKSTKRRDYSRTKYTLNLPDVLAMQKESFDTFLNKSIEQAMREYYPIKSGNGKVEISYVPNSKRIEKPQINEIKAIREVKQRGTTYSARIYAKLNKLTTETGETFEDEVLLCDIPLMTSGGSFIINGSEKVIVSQLIRSPGVYFATKTRDKQSDDLFNKVDILPRVGSWLEIKHKVSSDAGDNVSLKIKIDKNKQISLTLFLLSLGLTYKDMFALFGENQILQFTKDKDKFDDSGKTKAEIIKDAQDKIFRTIRKGDRVTREATRNLIPNLLFREKRYNLSETGRYLINRKLSLIDRIIGTYLAQDFEIRVNRKSVVLFKKGTFIDKDIATKIQRAFFDKSASLTDLKNRINLTEDVYGKLDEKHEHLKDRTMIVELLVYKSRADRDNDENKKLIIGNDPKSTETHLLISDIIAIVGYYFNLIDGIGASDDPDSLVNKRVVSVGELLLNQFSIGLSKMEKNTREKISSKDISKITPKNITNSKMIQNQIKTFFNSSKLSQFMDQTNPLAKISTKRKITSLGPGGLNRDTAQFDVRDVHATHYGRICPIETPEGPNIGLILNLATYSRISDLGFLETPYFKVNDGVVNYETPIYLTAYDELNKNIAQATVEVNENNEIASDDVIVKSNDNYIVVGPKEVDYISVSSNQMTSLAASCVPFLENNDANRALMGSNMQRQAVPLLEPEAPFVATGIESDIAKYSADNLRAIHDGEVTYVDGSLIKITPNNSSRSDVYNLRNFERSNQGTVLNQVPLVKNGEKVKAGDLITDASSFENGEMALGKNLLIGFTTFEGYNYEDAVIISERLVKEDQLTSIHIDEQTIQFRKSKAGDDELTAEIPNVSSRSKRNLDESGIVVVGSEVAVGDVLVGRVSPRGDENVEPAEKLLNGIFNQKVSNKKDTSLKVKNGHQGTVIDVQTLSRESGDSLEDGIDMIIKVFIAQKRKIKVGDKMAGRHGNKGVISRVVPVEDMPYLEDGTPLDIMLNPQGVPSRMNIGQVFELHLGMVAKQLGLKFVTPVFDGIKWKDIKALLKEANVPETGKMTIYNPKTSFPFDHPISVGIMYMIKLSHMVDDKMHARSVGPYSLITQQPLGGKSQNGGQRFGEMETWALQSYGASNILQEILTYKSDNIAGRNNLYGALTSGKDVPTPGIPESFNVLAYELRGLGIKIQVDHEKTQHDEIIDYEDVQNIDIEPNYGSLVLHEDMEDF